MIRQRIYFLFFLTSLMSCGKTNKLSEKDFKWMPYKGNETLVFKSNRGIEDTIFILKKDTLLGGGEQYSLSPILYEVLSIFCKHTDPFSTDGQKYYNENPFFKIVRGKDNYAEIEFWISAENANFYRSSKIKLDSLDKEKPSMLQTKHANYNDVYVINGEDILDYGKRSDFITKLFWSKSNGLVRYDKKDSVYWELAKKW